MTADQGASDSFWHFLEDVTLSGSSTPELKLGGQTPTTTIQNNPRLIVAIYPNPTATGDAWAITSIPTSISPHVAIQSGTAAIGFIDCTTGTPLPNQCVWDLSDDVANTGINSPQLEISADGITWEGPTVTVYSSPTQIVATYPTLGGSATMYRVLHQPAGISTPIAIPESGPTS